MKMVFQQKVQEKEQKLKQSEEELYARHREMKEALEKQRLDLEDKKRRVESGRPLTPEKGTVSCRVRPTVRMSSCCTRRKSVSVSASDRPDNTDTLHLAWYTRFDELRPLHVHVLERSLWTLVSSALSVNLGAIATTSLSAPVGRLHLLGYKITVHAFST